MDFWDVTFRIGGAIGGWCVWIILLMEPPEEPPGVFWTGTAGFVLLSIGAVGTLFSYDRWNGQHRLRPRLRRHE